MDTDVLIIGAGPTGLVLALWLTKLGVNVRIWEKLKAINQTSRAIAIQARTLELYRQLDLAEAVAERAHNGSAVNLWTNGAHRTSVPLETIGTGLTPFPGIFILPQETHEQILEQRLADLGINVERGVDFLEYTECGQSIVACGQDGRNVRIDCKARYIAGCDGAHSKIRTAFGHGFEGGTYPQAFYVADMEGHGGALNGQLHLDLSNSRDLLLVMSYDRVCRARIFGAAEKAVVQGGNADAVFDSLAARVSRVGIHMSRLNWFSTYKVHHRVAEKFRQGRAFVLGDAAHIHSPMGGQGMNTGIGDAVNLAWKLAAVLRGQSNESLLDTYEPERRAFALKLVRTTDEIFTMATSPGWLSKMVRTIVFPLLFPFLMRVPAIRTYAYGTVSQTKLNYRASSLSEPSSSGVSGGDRLPWVASVAECGPDNHKTLNAPVWQVHVYGTITDSLSKWCSSRGVVLHKFEFTRLVKSSGIRGDAAYLIRPDTYVAAVDFSGGHEIFDNYFVKHGLQLGVQFQDC
jgi:2-polyprenyl-6-methoxyphenol hydroxylase-like FAD-dependent oxidoreductase